ncbi:MAG TPA: adenylate/guanylate cyclase domain-containing protein [Solirubrobacterales bacterium]|nr:adenylate/guanylate cyclase domain-containing protein [Solirubrobacterales bacterium]
MHLDFRRLLEKAKGVSEFPIALNVDIRGFTKWSGDSAESGLFIKKTYIRLIDEYFANASFYKATGDGLLVIFPVDENDPQAAVRATVNMALKIVENFPNLNQGDPMINFETPQAVGVGLARGPASRLVSGHKVLDYSGSPLNLASRLMEVARPEGVILDGNFGYELLTPSIAKRFDSERVYLPGVAPKTGINIFYTKDCTEIPASAKRPIEGTKWGNGVLESTKRELLELPGTYMLSLDSTPADPNSIVCYIRHVSRTTAGRKRKGGSTRRDIPPDALTFREFPDGPVVEIAMPEVHRLLNRPRGPGPSWPVEICAEFIAV